MYVCTSDQSYHKGPGGTLNFKQTRGNIATADIFNDSYESSLNTTDKNIICGL
jgi:hypothetical protein